MEEATHSDISSSVVEFLEKEKIYKELCRSITEGVSPLDSTSSAQDKFLTPDDEINALLKQMNQILSPDEKTDVLDSSEERSVEVILKEAEDLIRSSTPLFLNVSSGSSTKTWPPPQRKLAAPCNVTQTISKPDDNESESDVNEMTNPNNESKEEKQNKTESSNKDLLTSLSSSKSSNRSSYSISEANDQIFKNIVTKKKQKSISNVKSRNRFIKEKPQEQLLLSDLAVPSREKSTSVSNSSKQEQIKRAGVTSPQEKSQGEVEDLEKKHNIKMEQLKKSYDEKNFDLKNQINILNAKLHEYERISKNKKTEAEILVTAQQKQIEMLEAELKTQEQLIAGYQRENHKLCQEMNSAKARVTYNGSQVLQVQGFPKTYRDELAQLQNKGVLELWNMNVSSMDLFVKRNNLGIVKNKLTKDKLKFKVVVENLQEIIDKESYILSKATSYKQGGFFNFDYYHRMADIHGYLEYLAHTYPQFVQLQDIGFSVEGRPLKVVKISSGVANAKSVWIDGGIHAREWISVASVTYIISELVENRYAHSAYTRGIDYYILPILNPDGYEYSHTVDRLWRKNRAVSSACVGTDLNRNWGFHWGGPDVSRIYCSETYPGPVAFSEPETRIVANFILSHAANMKAYISFHSYGQYILYPWGYDRTYPSDYTDLDRVGREVATSIAALQGSTYTVGSSATLLYSASGGSDDWVKGVANVKYSYAIELRDTGTYGFLLPPTYIRATGAEALAAEHWKQRENQMLDEKQQLQNELHGMSASSSEAVKEELKDAKETIVRLQLELATSRSNCKELELNCDRLRGDVIRLEAEIINYQSQVADLNKRDDKAAATAVFATTTALSSQLADARNVITRKDAEIVRLNTSLGTVRAELNRRQITNPSNQNFEIESLNVTISQLQAALSLERDHSKELNREKDALLRETVDLKRQVRELEVIVKRRNRSESQIPLSHRSDRSDNRIRELERELSVREDALGALHSQLQNMQKKYEDHIIDLEERLKSAQLENQSLKSKRSEHLAGSNRNKKSGPVVALSNAAVKEDAHLIATIRGLKQELAGKEKDMTRLNKELDDAKKTNRRLQKEREKQLNPTTMKASRGASNLVKEVEKVSSLVESVGSSLSSAKSYNPLLFAEVQETMTVLKSENKTLQTEVKKLEQDLITMHGKRVHDLNALQADHDLEIARLLNEQAARHSQSNVTELQGQIYTQQVVINHLKQQLKQAEELKEETAMLRAERSQLEETLMELKKNLDSLKSLQSPESSKQENVLAMLETIKRNSEIREQKLQSIVRDLLSRTSQSGHCSGSCCEKLLDKNRQLCYYCAEMDKILEPLREFRRKK